jgi:hypothetical protein
MKTKWCNDCKKHKPLNEWSNGRPGFCKKCMAARARKYYYDNREKLSNRTAIARQKVFDYLINNPCIDCGERCPVVLEFDHRNSKEKNAAVSSMVAKGHLWDTIQKEIDKCDVRCANCHRMKTAKDFNWGMLTKWNALKAKGGI